MSYKNIALAHYTTIIIKRFCILIIDINELYNMYAVMSATMDNNIMFNELKSRSQVNNI